MFLLWETIPSQTQAERSCKTSNYATVFFTLFLPLTSFKLNLVTPFPHSFYLNFSLRELSETISSETNGIGNYLADSTTASLHSQDIKRELVILSLPALAGQAIDPLTQLMETAYIGRLGKVDASM